MSLPRYQDALVDIDVEGREVEQTVRGVLRPRLGRRHLPHPGPRAPRYASTARRVGITPRVPVPVPSGEHRIEVKLAGYKAWRDILQVRAEETRVLPPIDPRTRRRAPERPVLARRGWASPWTARIAARPPTELTLTPGREHRLRVFKIGFGAPRPHRARRVGPGDRGPLRPCRP